MSQQINLFNPIFLKQKKVFTALAMAYALALLAAGALSVAYYGKHQIGALQKEAVATTALLAQKRARQEKVAAEFAPRQRSKELETQLAAAEAELKELEHVSGVLLRGEFGNTQGYSEYFKAFARQHVSGLWLTGISIEGAGNEVGVRGRALEPSLVPNFIGRLRNESIMQGKTFGSLQINRVTQAKLVAADGKAANPGGLAPFVEFSLQSAIDVVRE